MEIARDMGGGYVIVSRGGTVVSLGACWGGGSSSSEVRSSFLTEQG